MFTYLPGLTLAGFLNVLVRLVPTMPLQHHVFFLLTSITIATVTWMVL